MAYEYRIQLTDRNTGRAINHDGEFCVSTAGAPLKVAITDLDDVAVSTYSKAIVDGSITFRTAETVSSVDIFGYTDKGYPFQIRGATPGSITEHFIDLSRADHTLIIPFDIDDTLTIANTETNTGFELTGYEYLMPWGAGVLVTTADSGITVDLGTDGSGGSNDADGFFDGISLTSAVFVPAAVGYDIGSNNVGVDITGAEGEWTMGALFHPANTKVAAAEGADAATTDGNGIYFIIPYVGDADDDITFTLASSADTGAGYFILPLRLHTLAAA